MRLGEQRKHAEELELHLHGARAEVQRLEQYVVEQRALIEELEGELADPGPAPAQSCPRCSSIFCSRCLKTVDHCGCVYPAILGADGDVNWVDARLICEQCHGLCNGIPGTHSDAEDWQPCDVCEDVILHRSCATLDSHEGQKIFLCAACAALTPSERLLHLVSDDSSSSSAE